MSKNSHVKVISEKSRNDIENRLQSFGDKWNTIDGLVKCCGKFDYVHQEKNIGLISYVDYENLSSMFFDNIDDFITIGAYIVGSALVSLTSLTWGEMSIGGQKTLVLVEDYESCLRIPIVPMTLYKYTSITYDTNIFEDLFFDILFSGYCCQHIQRCHPFSQINTDDFFDLYGFIIPEDIITLIEPHLTSEEKEQTLLRHFGIEVYHWCQNGEWDKVRNIFKQINKYTNAKLNEYFLKVIDQETFLTFAKALQKDKENESSLLFTSWGGINNEWENNTISGFLESATAYFEDSHFIDKRVGDNPWKRFALFLYAGKFYE
jgi:hypothetical protein